MEKRAEDPYAEEDAIFRASEAWKRTWEAIRDANLDDESKWGDPIERPKEYLDRALGGE